MKNRSKKRNLCSFAPSPEVLLQGDAGSHPLHTPDPPSSQKSSNPSLHDHNLGLDAGVAPEKYNLIIFYLTLEKKPVLNTPLSTSPR